MAEHGAEGWEAGADDADGLFDGGPHGCVDGAVHWVVGVGEVKGYYSEDGDDAYAAFVSLELIAKMLGGTYNPPRRKIPVSINFCRRHVFTRQAIGSGKHSTNISRSILAMPFQR